MKNTMDGSWDCSSTSPLFLNFVSSRLGWVWGESCGDLRALSIDESVPVFCVGAATARYSLLNY